MLVLMSDNKLYNPFSYTHTHNCATKTSLPREHNFIIQLVNDYNDDDDDETVIKQQ